MRRLKTSELASHQGSWLIFDFGNVLIEIDPARSIKAFQTLGAQADLHLDADFFHDFETGALSAAEFRDALRGQRRLLLLKNEAKTQHLSMAFVPLTHPLESDAPTVLVLLQRQNACENVSVRMFARAQNLSPSEEVVMMALCRGLSIPEIAQENGVAQSTVRSQIKALREKTGCASIRHLLQRINSLPPMVSALRAVSPVSHNAMA